MGPAPTTFDNMLPSSNSTLFNIPKLAKDGTNWITYKERLLTTIGVRGLMRYIDCRVKIPLPYQLDQSSKKIVKEDGRVVACTFVGNPLAAVDRPWCII